MPKWVPSFECACRRCAPCRSSSWSFTDCLYFLWLKTIGWRFHDLPKLLWGSWRQVYGQHQRNGGLGMRDLENHWFAERLAYLGLSWSTDAVWRRKARDTFLRLKSDPKAEGRRKPRGEELFAWECRKALCNFSGFSDLSRSQKGLYRELVVGSTSDPLVHRLSRLMKEVRSH